MSGKLLAPFDFGGFPAGNVGTPTAGTDAATKAYADALGTGWLSVKSYGATGDGTTDDTAALTAAVAAANTAGGGTVYFPKGTYRVASGWTGLNSRNNIKLLGPAGIGTNNPYGGATIKCDAALSGTSVAFSATSSYGLEFRNLTFQLSAHTTAAVRCLDLTNSQDVTINNCAFMNTSTSKLGYGIEIGSALRVTIDRCMFAAWYYGVSTVTGGSRLVAIRDSYFITYNYGVSLGASNTLDWTVSGGDFSDTGGGQAIVSNGAGNVLILNNRVRNTGTAVPGQFQLTNTAGATISDNRLDSASATTSTTNRGIFFTGSASTGLVITGNYVDTAGGTGIYWNSADTSAGVMAANVYGTTSVARIGNVGAGVVVIESSTGVYNVKDFGALGDASTDDSAAITAAITAAGNNGVVYFPKGIYSFGSAYTGFQSKTGLRFVGQGGGSSASPSTGVVFTSAVATGTLWSATSTNSVEFINITFRATGLTSSGTTVLDLNGAIDMSLTNCAIINTSANARYGTGASMVGASKRITFDHCYFNNLNFCMQSNSACTGVTVRDSYFVNYTSAIRDYGHHWTVESSQFNDSATGQAVQGTIYVSNFLMKGCRITGTGSTVANGFLQLYGNGISILDNYLEGIYNGSTLIRTPSGVTGMVIAGNSFYGDGTNIAVNFVAAGSGTNIYAGGNFFSSIGTKYSNLPTGGGNFIQDNIGIGTVPTVLTATATLDFGSILSGYAVDLTMTVTGAAVDDVVACSMPSSWTSFLVQAFVSATNTVTVRAFNATAGAVDPVPGPFTVKVFKN